MTDAVLMSTWLAYPCFSISKCDVKSITGCTILSNEFQYMSMTWWKDESNRQNNVKQEEIKKLIHFFFYNSLCTYVWKWEWINYKEEYKEYQETG